MAILVHNYRPFPVQLRGWEYERLDSHLLFSKWGFVREFGDWSTIPAGTGQPHFSKEFIGQGDSGKGEWVAVQIDTDRVVWDKNSPPPRAPIGTIVTGERNKDGWTGGEWLAQKDLLADGRIATDGISITRVEDTDNHIRFLVDLT
jgi:hypothetical protein